MPLCIGVFRIIFFANERLLIAFLVRLICYMVLPHFCAVLLKDMYFNFTAYYLFSLMYFTTTQRAIYNFFLPDLVLHLLTFLCSPIKKKSKSFELIKLLCTHDFSRVTFATELSTNLVYKSIFGIDFYYISFICCFSLQ